MSAFTETQKQYLSGLAMGADVARAVRGLPVVSQSAGQTISVGGDAPRSPVLDADASLSKEEQAKRRKDPLEMWDEMQQRADANAFPSGTDVFLQKYQGLFYVAPAQNSYMCRMRIPGGALRAHQLHGIADLADDAAGGYVDVTTRANLQIREIPASRAMDILYGLRELDVVCLGSGGDNIRNCTSSPLSGFDPHELIETLPWARRMHHYILNHREMYGLPRKFNIAFDGGGTISALDDTNDIGFHAVRVPADQASEDLPEGIYFRLRLGGITGHRDFARDTGVLVRPQETILLAAAIIRVFIQHGDRTDRKKARLKYVLDRMGIDGFLELVQREYGRSLRRVDARRIEANDAEDRWAHVGFHPQRQSDLTYVGVVLPVGRIASDQLRALADIATRYGSGEVRLTVWQNVIIPHIRRSDTSAVQAVLSKAGLEWSSSAYRAGLVACTGSAGCKFAAADTKQDAMRIASHLERALPQLDQPINIHLTGCHHSCAQHYIGDLGLIACQVEMGDDMVDGYHIHVGGGWGRDQQIARQVMESVPAERAPQVVGAIVRAYQRHRQQAESFAEFARRHDQRQLRSWAAQGLEAIAAGRDAAPDRPPVPAPLSSVRETLVEAV